MKKVQRCKLCGLSFIKIALLKQWICPECEKLYVPDKQVGASQTGKCGCGEPLFQHVNGTWECPACEQA